MRYIMKRWISAHWTAFARNYTKTSSAQRLKTAISVCTCLVVANTTFLCFRRIQSFKSLLFRLLFGSLFLKSFCHVVDDDIMTKNTRHFSHEPPFKVNMFATFLNLLDVVVHSTEHDTWGTT